MNTPRPNTLATANLDRVSDRRIDPDWVAAEWESSSSRVHIVWRGTFPVVGDRSSFVKPSAVGALAVTPILLGVIDGVTHFGVDLSGHERDTVEKLTDADAMLSGLRETAAILHADDANLLAATSGLATWHVKHRFCGSCGTETEVHTAGHERRCPSCGTPNFPRTDPAVIMLVTDGDRAVLGRQKIWPAAMFSTLAGFVEPGESLEDAVVREVREEVGLVCDSVRYSSSQPWPFPQSLMVGFHAKAVTTEIVVHPTEMDDAQWFSRDQLDVARTAGTARGRTMPMIPPPLTIARRLLDEWLDT
jgi:NAD+ diphosphatase